MLQKHIFRAVSLMVIIALVSMLSIAFTCGDNVCEGRDIVNQQPHAYGLGRENWDNCPQDCGIHPVSRNLADIYHTNEQVYSIMDDLISQHPSFISKEVIGQSTLNNPIYLYKIGNGSWKFMMDGRIHGMEDCGTEAGLNFIDWIINNDSVSAEEIRQNSTFLFIPVLLPDAARRQNLRTSYVDENGTEINVSFGVDLNRNFATRFNISGSADPTDSYQYRGPNAVSEPESQALLNALQTYRPNVYMNTHCGQFKLISVGTESIDRGLLSKSANLGIELNTDVISKFGAKNGYLINGYAMADAAIYANSSWLFEISNWTELPKSLNDFTARIYPDTFPILVSFAVPEEHIPNLTPVFIIPDIEENSTQEINTTPDINNTIDNITQNQTANITTNSTFENNDTIIQNSTDNSTSETPVIVTTPSKRSSGSGGGSSSTKTRQIVVQNSTPSQKDIEDNLSQFLNDSTISEDNIMEVLGVEDVVESIPPQTDLGNVLKVNDSTDLEGVTGAVVFTPGKLDGIGLFSQIGSFFSWLFSWIK